MIVKLTVMEDSVLRTYRIDCCYILPFIDEEFFSTVINGKTIPVPYWIISVKDTPGCTFLPPITLYQENFVSIEYNGQIDTDIRIAMSNLTVELDMEKLEV